MCESVIELAIMLFLKRFEGFSSKAYICPGGRNTIGYGHVINEREVELKNQTIDEEIADALLRYDCKMVYEEMKELIHVPLEEHQLAALLSFCFNVGINAFKHSTLRAKINAGKLGEASKEFLKWDKINGKSIKGLADRRREESNLFFYPA